MNLSDYKGVFAYLLWFLSLSLCIAFSHWTVFVAIFLSLYAYKLAQQADEGIDEEEDSE